MKAWLICAIIVLAAGGFFGYKIFLKDQAKAQHIREQLQQEHKLGDRRSQLEDSLGLLESYRRRLCPKADAGWLMRQVGDLANSAGLDVSTINPGKARRLGGITQLSVSLHLIASYHQLGQFLSRIESAEYLLHVDDLDFRRARAQHQDSMMADVDLVVSTFYMPPFEL